MKRDGGGWKVKERERNGKDRPVQKRKGEKIERNFGFEKKQAIDNFCSSSNQIRIIFYIFYILFMVVF